MIPKFFINRPIFATVLALLITLGGIVAITKLPIEQYPDLTPPTIEVSATYLGASPEVIAQTVAAPLEEQINGVENMLYMDSTSSADGSMSLTVYFKIGSDPDKALIDVNNRVQQASSSLPAEVTKYGLTVQKRSSSLVLLATLYSPDGMYDVNYIGNYALVNIIDELKRIKGVGDAQVMTSNDYAIRIWLKPDLFNRFNLGVNEVISAVETQNAQRSGGTIGAMPMSNTILKTFPLITPPRLVTPEQFGNIILRASPDGSTLRIKDIADVTLGAQTYTSQGYYDKKPAVPIGIYLSAGANAVETANLAKKALAQMSQNFPEGISYDIAYDTTVFVKESIKGVIVTLVEAFILVFFVVLLFLKDWRATLIPCVVVPVAIIGAFLGMLILGFSINSLTLFGLVLAIGMVVDDAIVVIENADRILTTQNMPVKEAVTQAMQEVSGPIVAIVLVLCSVFIPVGFMGGFSGVMYQQFAITIAISVVISGLMALTLTPAMCALMLEKERKVTKGFFFHFDNLFEKFTGKYVSVSEFFIRKVKLGIILFAVFCLLAFILFKMVPSNLLPDEDQGLLMVYTGLDPATSLTQTDEVAGQLEDVLLSFPEVKKEFSFSGFNILNSTSQTNSIASFVTLKPWDERKKKNQSASALVGQISQAALAKIPKAYVLPFMPPPIMGLSTTGGIEGYIQSRGNGTPEELADVTNKFIDEAKKIKGLSNTQTTYSASYPQYTLTVDNVKALSMGLNLDDLYNTLSSTIGASYINDFTLYSRNFKVMIQAEAAARQTPEQVGNLYIKSNIGAMVPLSAVATITPSLGPSIVERFNAFPSANLVITPEGISSGQAIKALENLAQKVLPENYALSWSGTALEETQSGSSSALILLLGIVVVFLILAAQYESWSLPFCVLTAVPFAIFGAFLGTWFRGLSNGIYFQVALVALIGLAAKNAILIVEFALMLKQKGASAAAAAMQGAKIRFRPIIMTSLAFILGTLPLATSSGAGAASQISLGTAVVFGMLGATIFAPCFVPLFFYVLNKKRGEVPNFDLPKGDKE